MRADKALTGPYPAYRQSCAGDPKGNGPCVQRLYRGLEVARQRDRRSLISELGRKYADDAPSFENVGSPRRVPAMKHGADLGMLRTFLYVYRCGGVAKAAGLLGLSQPAVSRHLKALEGITGRTLFDRLGRGVAPTQAGVLLATQIATHLDALEGAIDALSPSESTGPMLLGAPSDLLAVHILPKLTPLLAQGIDVHCRVSLSSPELAQALLHDELDLAVVTRIEQAPTRQLHLRHLFEEEFVLVGRAGEAPYAPEDDTRRFIGYSPTMPMARRYFRECWGIQPPAPALTVADIRTVVAAITAGIGLSVVPRHLAQEALDAGRLTLLHNPATPVSNSIYLATRRGREHLPQIIAAFELLCQAV